MSRHPVDLAAVAKQFALALDQDDFASAEHLLADACVYEARAGTVIGAAAVVASYREASAWTKANLDAVRYESLVLDTGESTISVLFLDHITHQGKNHTYKCQQHLLIDSSARIERIRHIELPGQREALTSFLGSVGLARQ